MQHSRLPLVQQRDPPPVSKLGKPVYEPTPAKLQAYYFLEQAIASADYANDSTNASIFNNLTLVLHDAKVSYDVKKVIREFFVWPYTMFISDIAYVFEADTQDERAPGIENWISHLLFDVVDGPAILEFDQEYFYMKQTVRDIAAAGNRRLAEFVVAFMEQQHPDVLWHVDNLLQGVVENGDVAWLQSIATKYGAKSEWKLSNEVASAAAASVPILVWLASAFPPETFAKKLPIMFVKAAAIGNVSALQWIAQRALPATLPTIRSFQLAVENGRVDAMVWIAKHFAAAAAAGLDVMAYESETSNAMVFAGKSGNTRFISALDELVPDDNDRAAEFKQFVCNGLVIGGHLELLRDVVERRTLLANRPSSGEFNMQHLFDLAAGYGQLDILTWLTENYYANVTSVETAFPEAASRGMVHIMDFLGPRLRRVVGYDVIAKNAVLKAIEGDHLKAVMWLHNQHLIDGRLTKEFLGRAIEFSSAAVLQWMLDINLIRAIPVKEFFEVSYVTDEMMLLLAYHGDNVDDVVSLVLDVEHITFNVAVAVLGRLPGIPREILIDTIYTSNKMSRAEMLHVMENLTPATIAERGEYIIRLTEDVEPQIALRVLSPFSPFVTENQANTLVELANDPELRREVREAASDALASIITFARPPEQLKSKLLQQRLQLSP